MADITDINIVVALGPTSTDTYYLGVGRQVCHNNLPKGLVEQIESGKLPNNRLRYLSLDKTAQYWCAEDKTGPTVSWNTPDNGPLDKLIRKGSATSGWVTFPDYDTSKRIAHPYYFVASKTTGKWAMLLPDDYMNTIKEIKAHIPSSTFDNSVKWILFGTAGTHVYQLTNGYITSLGEQHKDHSHPLVKALMEYDPDFNPSVGRGEWMIDKGSSISLHDHRYFFLKFTNTRTKRSQFKYCLPPHLEQKIEEMIKVAQSPAERDEVAFDNQLVTLGKFQHAHNMMRRELEIDNVFDGASGRRHIFHYY
ncbi:hypothetical protein CVT24_008688 [Panaeolus cyanescens]|uniref:Uncharacterized protein n=1 Tax=Panaeolus cyanescens TaxID=181874 RepID=A0A409VKN7_9AGAR|nr:hypothetical protein CVT24_008688 [Panaeolus cyanescens]